MKYFLSAFLLSVFTLTAYGENSIKIPEEFLSSISNSSTSNVSAAPDSVDIRQMVEEQISAIKIRQLEEAKKSENITEKKSGEKSETSLTSKDENRSDLFYTSLVSTLERIKTSLLSLDVLNNKFSILGFATILIFSVVIIRRKILSRQKDNKNSLKENIRLLREEKAVKKLNPKLTDVRNSLIRDSLTFANPKAGISKIAKELNIAKGEILLAAKLKSHELNKAG